MENVDLVGIDLAKSVFQLHGCSSTGEEIFRKQLRRNKLLLFISELPPCTIAMEACSGSHYWGREFEALGHLVRLIAPKYVKPFVKRSKSPSGIIFFLGKAFVALIEWTPIAETLARSGSGTPSPWLSGGSD